MGIAFPGADPSISGQLRVGRVTGQVRTVPVRPKSAKSVNQDLAYTFAIARVGFLASPLTSLQYNDSEKANHQATVKSTVP